MAISLIQTAKSASTGASPQTATFGATPLANSLIIANNYSNTSGATAITNFTDRSADSVGNTTQRMNYKDALNTFSQSATVTVTDGGTATLMQLVVQEYAGVDQTPHIAYSVAITPTTTTATTLTTPSIVTTVPNCLLISTWTTGGNTAIASTTVNAPFTTSTAALSTRCGLAYQIVSSTGTYSCTWNWATAQRATVGIVAYPMTPVTNTGSTLMMMGV